MKPELQGIDAKIDRAIEHLNVLNTETRAFAKRQTHGLRGNYEPETRTYSFKATISEAPSLRVGIVLGDVVHNLRSALDHLVWQLVLRAAGTPGRWTKFPLYDDPGEFTRQVTTPGLRGKRNPLLGLEGTAAWAAIEALQPHHGGEGQRLLGALHDLSNEDKHRVVLRTAQAIRHPGVEPPLRFTPNADAGEIIQYTVRVGRPLHDGTEIVSVRLAPTGPNPEVEMHGELEVGIGFGERKVLNDVLPKMIATVLHVTEDFAKRFF